MGKLVATFITMLMNDSTFDTHKHITIAKYYQKKIREVYITQVLEMKW